LFRKLFKSSQKRTEDELRLTRFMIDQFGYRPKDIAYFKIAVTHKSILHKGQYLESNERLEFLGDSILGSVIAEWLYAKFPREDEGYLTQLKSKIVSRKILSEIAEKLKVRSVIQYQEGRSMNIATIEGNCLEALFGAMYLDGGFEAVKTSITQYIFGKYVDVKKLLAEEIDFKSKLLILTQRNKWELDFRVLQDSQNSNQHLYEIEVFINDVKYGIGTASSKKEAEQIASKESLMLLNEI
jgi:ribonuclease-3